MLREKIDGGIARNTVLRLRSVLSASGVSIELVADVMGHSTTRTTEAVHRHSVLPTVGGAVLAMDHMSPDD
jgi:hypothetical protein